jgi:hypothetical protein
MRAESDRLYLLTLFPLLKDEYNAVLRNCLHLGSNIKDGWRRGMKGLVAEAKST